jgi:hypothetical protein
MPHLARAGIGTEVQLALAPRRANTTLLIQPFAFAVNLQAGAIDKQMQGLLATGSPWRDCQAVQHYLWRAVDQDGVVLDILVQPRRDANAAKRSSRTAEELVLRAMDDRDG